MSDLAFPKSNRLLNQAQFKFVFDHVDLKQSGKYFTILARFQPEPTAPRLGIIVSKRNVPSAAARNYLKRITRETFRQNVLSSSGTRPFDVIVLAKATCKQQTKSSAFNSLTVQWDKLLTKIAANS